MTNFRHLAEGIVMSARFFSFVAAGILDVNITRLTCIFNSAVLTCC